MPEQVMRFAQPPIDKWNALELSQKIKIGAIVAVVLIALALTVFLVTRVTYAEAIHGLDDADAVAISNLLNEQGIRHNVRNGVLYVEDGQQHQARAAAMNINLATDGMFTYQDALGHSGIGSTETITRENLRRARITDLEMAMRQFDGVQRASINLVLPDDNRFFVRNSEVAHAGVALVTSRELSFEEGEAIARFLRRSVQGLEMENIEIMDSNFRLIYSADIIPDPENQELARRDRFLAQENARVMGNVRDRFVSSGYAAVVVVPNLYFSADHTEVHSEEFRGAGEDGYVGIPTQRRISGARVQGAGAGAYGPGLPTNNMQTPGYPMGGDAGMNARQDDAFTIYGVDRRIEITTPLHTNYTRELSSISVAMTRITVHDQELLRRANGISDDDWYSLMVEKHALQGLPIDNTEETGLNGLIEHYTAWVSNATGIPVERVSVSIAQRHEFVSVVPAEGAGVGSIIMFALLALVLIALILGLIIRTQPQEEEEPEPELSVEDLLVSTQMEEALAEETAYLEAIGYREDSLVKQKVEEFIDEKPEAAASLMRHWLNETEF